MAPVLQTLLAVVVIESTRPVIATSLGGGAVGPAEAVVGISESLLPDDECQSSSSGEHNDVEECSVNLLARKMHKIRELEPGTIPPHESVTGSGGSAHQQSGSGGS